METKAYACYNQDNVVRDNSSSGGVYSLLAEQVINAGGVVYAACYNEKLDVVHTRIDKVEDIPKSRGSKYVFSSIGKSIQEIKELLEQGINVMFVGTPCQCAGVLKVAGENRDKLLCVDFVCHGVPEQKIWHMYLDALNKRGIDLVDVNMRCKDTGWSNYNYCWKYTSKDGKTIIEKQKDNPYMKGFVGDFYLRNVCYNCQFKGYERLTDITLADFWGIWDLHPEMDDNKGTSLVMLHTEKGQEYYQKISESIVQLEVTKEEAIKNNPSIVKSAVKTDKYDMFNKMISEGKDFITVIERMKKVSFLTKIKRKIKHVMAK